MKLVQSTVDLYLICNVVTNIAQSCVDGTAADIDFTNHGITSQYTPTTKIFDGNPQHLGWFYVLVAIDG